MRRHSRATGAVAIAHTLAPTTQFQLNEVRVHLSAGGAATNLTITLVSSVAVAYNQVLLTQAMAGVSDIILLPAQPHDFVAGDAIVVEYANGGGATYGVDVIWSRTA